MSRSFTGWCLRDASPLFWWNSNYSRDSILQVSDDFISFWKPAEKWRNEEGISKKSSNLNIKNDFYVYCSNCTYSEISICFFLIYHLESYILMLFFLRTEGNIFSFRMQSSEFFFKKICLLKVHYCRFENLPKFLDSYKNNIWKIRHS